MSERSHRAHARDARHAREQPPGAPHGQASTGERRAATAHGQPELARCSWR
jgi:hypothetical protein